MANNIVPKSLHTVRVLVEVARLYMQHDTELSADTAVTQALIVLGYGNTPDIYELGNKAVQQLNKGK